MVRILITKQKNKDFLGFIKDTVITLPREKYLRGVVVSEMPTWAGAEALKAGTVAARSYVENSIRKNKAKPYDVTDTTADQAYNAWKARELSEIEETAGEVLFYNGKLIDKCKYTASNNGWMLSGLEVWNVNDDRPYLVNKYDPHDVNARRKHYGANTLKKPGHRVGMSQIGTCQMEDEGASYKNILDFYYPGTEVIRLKTIGEELGFIGGRGGHACGDNPIDKKYGYPAYNEGDFVHEMTAAQCEAFGWPNLETEKIKLDWKVIAKRGAAAGCDSILYNHTNWSLDRKGNPNSGAVVIIYPFENEQHKPMYEQMAEIIAKHMRLSRFEARIRMSKEYERKNYYSAIHLGMKYGIRHPLIVEYGYHVDIAGREEERTAQIISAIDEILITEIGDTMSFTPIGKGLNNEKGRTEEVQKMLVKLLYSIGHSKKYPNGIDDDFGSKTKRAVKAFQKNYAYRGLPQKGVVDEATWNVLKELTSAPVEVEPEEPGGENPSEAIDYDWLKGKLKDAHSILEEIENTFI